ncbi:hypothetical protein DFH28DRAFT_901765, partial [Melampsora americana]
FQSINLTPHQKLEKNDFVLIKGRHLIAQVVSLWKVVGEAETNTLVVLHQCKQGWMLEFYGMQEITLTDDVGLKNIKDIHCLLNVQHNCHDAQCVVEKTHHKRFERKISSNTLWGVQHVDHNSFGINGASQYSSELHRRASDFIFHAVTPEDWTQAVDQGLDHWKAESKPAKRGKAKD